MEGGKFAFKAEGKYLTAKDIYSTDIELQTLNRNRDSC